jgi:hypothetical protein
LSRNPTICELASRAMQNGFNPAEMGPYTAAISLVPALLAMLINRKPTAAPKQGKSDVL